MTKDKGLVGKLNGVSVGDVIFLRSNHTNLWGYVTQLDKESVKLSVEDPNKHDWRARSIFSLLNPAKKYELCEFESYNIIESHHG